MLKLADNFYITSINNYKGLSNRLKLIEDKEYTFVYKNYKIQLMIEFQRVGYTREDNIAIINFGYAVDIDKWSNRRQSFEWIEYLDKQDGSSTKKYFDSTDARKIVLCFIEKTIDKYLKKISPAIVIRGALSDIKINLPRYKRLDKQFIKNSYTKQELSIDKFDSLYKLTSPKEKDDKVIWAYSKKVKLLQQLADVFK